MFAVRIEPLLPGNLLTGVQRPLLDFHPPVHGLLGHLRGKIRRAIHSAK
jgi:hypothetical protein